LKLKATPHESAAIDGILKEAYLLAHEIADTDTRDAAMLAALQEVAHYDITRYGTLVAWAIQLGLKDIAAGLKENLSASKEIDRALSSMAEASVNRLAAA
jgi:ferritin-like metal-binding protein YciE